MNNICPKIATCPLFNDTLLKRKESAKTYRSLFCNNSKKYFECKRYIISNEVGKCAPYVLPNSFSTTEELLERMRKDGIVS